MIEWEKEILTVLRNELRKSAIPERNLIATSATFGERFLVQGGINRCALEVETIEDSQALVEIRGATVWNKEYGTESASERRLLLERLSHWLECVFAEDVLERTWTVGSTRVAGELCLCDRVVLTSGFRILKAIGRPVEVSCRRSGGGMSPTADSRVSWHWTCRSGLLRSYPTPRVG